MSSGLEYLVELVPDERGKEPTYVCMLCDKKGDPRVAMAHIKSYNHRSKYIVSLLLWLLKCCAVLFFCCH